MRVLSDGFYTNTTDADLLLVKNNQGFWIEYDDEDLPTEMRGKLLPLGITSLYTKEGWLISHLSPTWKFKFNLPIEFIE